jgi:hypothetical protein
MTREEKLISDGWKKRSTLDEPRLSEMVAAYEGVGFEVRFTGDARHDIYAKKEECQSTTASGPRRPGCPVKREAAGGQTNRR